MRTAASTASPTGSNRLRNLDFFTVGFLSRLLGQCDHAHAEVVVRVRVRVAGCEVGREVIDEAAGELLRVRAPVDAAPVDHERGPADDVERGAPGIGDVED